MNIKTLGIIPARGGSRRLPRKNTLNLGGKPLVKWIIEAALRTHCLNRVVVSSDDDEILSIADKCRIGISLRRPYSLATDTSPSIDYVRHALSVIEEMGDVYYDMVVILQPTSPFTTPGDIKGTVDLLQKTGADSAVSVVAIDHSIHPAKLKVMRGDKLFPYYEEEEGRMSHHELPLLYIRNGSVYATWRENIDNGRIIGEDCRGYIMPRERSIDINEGLDLIFAEFLLSRRKSYD